MMETFDQHEFRSVLGTFATGVVIVSTCLDGKPEGMTIGAFTSVSLAPPLVAFLPAKNSKTWPRIRKSEKFTINILGHDQEELCRTFARTSEEKFSGVSWVTSDHGTPHLEGALAWLNCKIYNEFDAGDHDIVVGEVSSLFRGQDKDPLVFHSGKFRTLAIPSSAVLT
ncbi:MAG: flavin reductase family protein [Pseudomonadota bacterium]